VVVMACLLFLGSGSSGGDAVREASTRLLCMGVLGDAAVSRERRCVHVCQVFILCVAYLNLLSRNNK
jgi:hypothetical protein